VLKFFTARVPVVDGSVDGTAGKISSALARVIAPVNLPVEGLLVGLAVKANTDAHPLLATQLSILDILLLSSSSTSYLLETKHWET
jgi:hypothetical protein